MPALPTSWFSGTTSSSRTWRCSSQNWRTGNTTPCHERLRRSPPRRRPVAIAPPPPSQHNFHLTTTVVSTVIVIVLDYAIISNEYVIALNSWHLRLKSHKVLSTQWCNIMTGLDQCSTGATHSHGSFVILFSVSPRFSLNTVVITHSLDQGVFLY